MMKAPLKLMLLLITLFCFAAVGLEMYRFVSFQLELEQALRGMLRDAMELHLDDPFRASHVSYIRPEEVPGAKAFVRQMLRDRYGLDAGLRQTLERDFIGPMVIPEGDFIMDGGAYTDRVTVIDGYAYTEPVQQRNPSGQLRVLAYYKPMIFRLNDALGQEALLMDVSVAVEHRRYEGY